VVRKGKYSSKLPVNDCPLREIMGGEGKGRNPRHRKYQTASPPGIKDHFSLAKLPKVFAAGTARTRGGGKGRGEEGGSRRGENAL